MLSIEFIFYDEQIKEFIKDHLWKEEIVGTLKLK
jgi:hypothetical protein